LGFCLLQYVCSLKFGAHPCSVGAPS
jgi:hypothetical protein